MISQYFLGLGFINCDDEEDCIQGSGSGDGTGSTGLGHSIDFPRETNAQIGNGNNEEVYQVGGTDSELTRFFFQFTKGNLV